MKGATLLRFLWAGCPHPAGCRVSLRGEGTPPTKSLRAAVMAAFALGAGMAQAVGAESMIWRVESPKQIGRQTPTVLGAPRAVEEDGRKAIRFNGASDGLILPVIPIQGWKAFTIEVLFKPDGDGPEAQRFVHLEDKAENRGLIETRVTAQRQWYLDTFLYVKARDAGVTLVDKTKLHPCDRWYWAALVYDGKTMSHFVNATKEKEGAIDFGPLGEGRTSLGVRLNQVFWFKGAIAEVRFHPRALAAGELQQ